MAEYTEGTLTQAEEGERSPHLRFLSYDSSLQLTLHSGSPLAVRLQGCWITGIVEIGRYRGGQPAPFSDIWLWYLMTQDGDVILRQHSMLVRIAKEWYGV